MTNPSQPNSLEKCSVAFALLLLIGGVVYFVNYFFSHSDVKFEEPYTTNTPVTGNVAHVESITTGWVKEEAVETIYPTGTITLDPAKSKSGSIRVLFKKDVGVGLDKETIIGDSNSFKVTNGLFDNGTNTVTITCTKGLPNMAEFLGYCSQDNFRWTIVALEPKADSSEFVEFAHAAIDTVILESE